MSRYGNRLGGDDELEPVVRIDLIQPAGHASEPLGESGRVIRERLLATDLGQDADDLIGGAGEIANDIREPGQLLLQPGLAEPLQLRRQADTQGVALFDQVVMPSISEIT